MIALVAGLLFSVGLCVSGMTQPAKVLGFLDFAGHWDPSLGFVMLGAVAVYFFADRFSRRLARPLHGGALPPRGTGAVDLRLVGGAAIFGVGWGLSGFCPGPAIVTLGSGALAALFFVPSMVAGMLLQRRLQKRTP
jgi:uncharacterized membrane protein YedE/YeeE